MSRKLRDFLELLGSPAESRDETEMGSYVSWLRRRTALLKHIQTRDVIEIIRRARHVHADQDEVVFQQMKSRNSIDSNKFFIIVRGSVSMFVNPFLSQGKTSRTSFQSVERSLLSTSPSHSSAVRFLVHPSSAASKATSVSRKSAHAPVKEENPESDVSDAESDVSIPAEVTSNTEAGESGAVPEAPRVTAEPSPASRASKASSGRVVRSKLGKFIVKYEKGKYFGEDAILDDEGCYTSSIIADEPTDIIVLDDDNFNKYVKQQHEREVTKLTNFVDVHPFFCALPPYSKGVIQISLKSEHHAAGAFIVRQGEPLNRLIFIIRSADQSVAVCSSTTPPASLNIVRQGEPLNRLIFIISGSAEVIVEPGKHRYQYPDLWPFETSDDVYYRECEWLRDSRRRMYSRKYEYRGEASLRSSRKASEQRQEVSVCAVQNKEVVGVVEFTLGLETHIQSLRCLHDCEVFTISLRPFRRIARRRNPEIMELVNAYVLMKLQFRMSNSLGVQVPLFRSLLLKIEKQSRDKSYNGMNTRNIQKIKAHERAVLQMLDWFRLDKCPLVLNRDPEVTQLKEEMKEKAKRRENIRQKRHEKPFFRTGCLAAVKQERQPRSLHQLRDPLNEVIMKLRMEGTFIEDEQELEEILMRYTQTPMEEVTDISSQADRVWREQYNLFRYRRHGNRLVRKFINLLATGTGEQRSKTPTTMRGGTPRTVDFSQVTGTNPDSEAFYRYDRWYERAMTRATTQPSRTSTHRSLLQFERRSVTPDTLSLKIRDFHEKYGGKDNEINTLPRMKKLDQESIDPDDSPVRGGKVFVTMAPCISCNKNVLLKDHNHVRCQMLHSLPMDRVKGYTGE